MKDYACWPEDRALLGDMCSPSGKHCKYFNIFSEKNQEKTGQKLPKFWPPAGSSIHPSSLMDYGERRAFAYGTST